VESIKRFTNLTRTTVFVCDDGSDDLSTKAYLDELERTEQHIVVIRNQQRLGVAGNSNRLLRCLERFEHFLLLNDDVEVLTLGWDTFYRDAMRRSGFCHFIQRQEGIYGARLGPDCEHGGVRMRVVHDRPHGAVLAGNRKLLDEIGYFDERYGIYGFEHVDWSSRVFEFQLQPSGFYDVCGSNSKFRVHPDDSSVPNRSQKYQEAKAIFENRRPARVAPSRATELPALSFVVPMRNVDGRTNSIRTVLDNLRAQRFPVVEIVLVEQDTESRFDPASSYPLIYDLVGKDQPLFNKSLAFNRGVQLAHHDHLILHDADTMAPSWYAGRVYQELQQYEACHLGAKVIYAVAESTSNINNTGIVDHAVEFDRVVGYYEGGSLGVRRVAYWRVGAFNEEFKGYGCEDCDFYYRVSHRCIWHSNRFVDLLHLAHGRSPGWEAAHKKNRELEVTLRSLPLDEYIRRLQDRVIHYTRSD
jgi:GT2 family glycosyltransferase